MRRSHLAALALALPLPAAGALRAQGAAPAPPDSAGAAAATPFRAGQWGAEFAGGAQLYSLGLLRFTSPRGAWLLTGSVGFSDEQRRTTDASGTGRSRFRNVGASARVGRRHYAPIGASVLRFLSAGASGAYDRYATDYGTTWRRSTTWSAGLFAEGGVSYLVTRHVSLGLTVGATARYADSRERSRSPNATSPDNSFSDRTSVALGVSPLSLVSTIYF